jgi:hypothetical protein
MSVSSWLLAGSAGLPAGSGGPALAGESGLWFGGMTVIIFPGGCFRPG